MTLFNINNPNPSQSLLEPFVRITVGNPNSKDADVFTVGDGKLFKAAVTLGEGKVQSNCRFTVRDPDKKLADKYFTYIESVGGLAPIQAPAETSTSPQVSSIENPAVDDGSANTTGSVIFENVKASTYGWGSVYDGGDTGAYGDKIDFEGMFAAMADTKYKYTKVRVTNLSNNKSIIVKIIDRGPFAIAPNGQVIRPLQEHPDRKIDLVRGAWKALTDNAPQGLVNVKIELIEEKVTTSSSSNTKSREAVKASQISSRPGNFTQDASLPVRMRAFLDVIAYAENSGYASIFEQNGGYNIMFTGKTFTSYADHPKRKFRSGSLVSNAAGRYQFLSGSPSPTWENAKRALNLPDFSPISQDKAAVWLIQNRGAYNDVLQGNFDTAISKLNTEWASLPGSPYGQPTKSLSQLREYYKQRLLVYQGGTLPSSDAKSSVSSSNSPQVENPPTATTKSGSQITVELGYGGKTIAAYSFIHVGLKYSLFDPHSLEFTGQSASWVLTQRVKNSVYTNITFKKLAQKITSSYGMKLVMPEEGPKYEYFPQRGQSDYEALLIEARRIGYRVYTKGATLYIQPRKGIDANQQVFVLSYGENMGTFFEVTHQASTDSKGGARSSQPGSNNSTGERKFEIDPDTGQVKQKRKENLVGTGANQDVSTTGSPLPLPAPKTTGDTNTPDAQRKANEDRIKGILAAAEFPTTPEALTLDPDTPFKTEGISTALDRYWVVDTVTHEYQTGKFTTKLTCYSPLKNKTASAAITNNEVKSISNPVLVDGTNSSFDPEAPKFIRPMTVGAVTSRHRSENSRRPNHKGIDISSVGGTGAGSMVMAAAAGTVSFAGFGANENGHRGYGWVVDIDHGGGWMTRYAHLFPGSLKVTTGQQVQQGQEIGTEGNSGASRGTHLHTEIRKNGVDLNPLKFYRA
ncbi:peptidoglycan DD-metalloendopeptidase family protein [Nostoc sp. FACHB-152]|uniref:peptidoglycan DD-metalloendopeptidase family protein n=1 Tax=Nostoc sp. FACHB-152 TaxID=2692837 RepID=UPI001685A29F|nr:peptidoglycan DD-metalloendopeptidase family protein [Nostoc sp. FACHB-152]MBD2452244.1 peptidoglycan DD-metalloendopeptidase family protein [Nostoc sp. FACHB-152]